MNSVNVLDKANLQARFGVTEPVLEEIFECLNEYFGRKPDITLAPEDVAFSGKIGSRPYVDLYEMNDANTWGGNALFGLTARRPSRSFMSNYLAKVTISVCGIGTSAHDGPMRIITPGNLVRKRTPAGE